MRQEIAPDTGQVDLARGAIQQCWERDAELAYVLQGGPFKGLGVKLRNYVYRSEFARGRDSNRVYVTYDVALW